LQFDLWWRGLNVALDAGTYLYNAAPPWENALRHTPVHNTITVNDLDQMTSAGKFLYLDRAQADVLEFVSPENKDHPGGSRSIHGSWSIHAQHDGYRRLGLLHRRKVTAEAGGGWLVEDELLADGRLPGRTCLTARLHWLLPDWSWEVFLEKDGSRLELKSPLGIVILRLSTSCSAPGLQLVRAGETIFGDGQALPCWGWSSPTYGDKIPALSVSYSVNGSLPIRFMSQWQFSEERVEDVS
jgi:hypothetical protein